MHYRFQKIPVGIEATPLVPAGETYQPETFQKPKIKN